MGETVKISDGTVDGKIVDSTTGAGTGNSSGSTRAADTRGNGSGTGTGNGSGAGSGETKEKGLPQLVTVTPEEQSAEEKRLERNRKRRERYQKEKAESGQTVKPRKVNKQKNSVAPVTNMTKEQMNNLIVSTSMVIASRPNCAHWMITEKEADSITTPLLAMISESEKLEMIAKNSNQIALVIACITIFVPRLFITIQMNKTTPKPPKKEIKPDARKTETRPPETGNQKPNIVNDGESAPANTNDDFVLSWDD